MNQNCVIKQGNKSVPRFYNTRIFRTSCQRFCKSHTPVYSLKNQTCCSKCNEINARIHRLQSFRSMQRPSNRQKLKLLRTSQFSTRTLLRKYEGIYFQVKKIMLKLSLSDICEFDTCLLISETSQQTVNTHHYALILYLAYRACRTFIKSL